MFKKKMCKVQILRVLMEQRLNAAVEEIFGLFERTVTEYEEELSRTKEENKRQRRELDAALEHNRADIQQVLLESEDEVSPEQQEWRSSLGRQEQERPHIKEEKEEPWEQLQEADVTTVPFTDVPVKSEDDEDKAKFSQLDYCQSEVNKGAELLTQHMTTEGDVNHCGGSQAEYAQPSYMTDMTSHSSETEDEDFKGDMRPEVDSQRFECSECERTFNRKESMKRHMVTHTGERPFTCSVCVRSFSLKQYLERHMMIHTGENPFSCSVCNNRFRDKFKLMVHMRKHAAERQHLTSSSTIREYGIHSDGSQASSGFAPLSDLNEVMSHASDHDHGDNAKEPSESKKDSKGDTRRHTDDNLLNCSHCKKTFDKRWKWKRHMKCHTAKKPFSCPLCAKGFTQKSDMTIHMAVHTGEKPFSCAICTKRFAAKKYMAIHMRTHTGERPYACSCCAKRFTTKPQMDRHMMRIHPFSCSSCKK
ncbi:gastrula zinc finger protein XlCGF57.1-like isoform X2 [Nerophis ophidion]|uniref:gastrula zinc finger protein XlCGF57.1-like isoform X2 n=1 Tax=Nerophis ophidion TaxID=159077 RepID=UPI002AE08ECD|nr:gastrula zinc finger protein XlCGF57.1-like isoform X2 [Nerophis ophidion]